VLQDELQHATVTSNNDTKTSIRKMIARMEANVTQQQADYDLKMAKHEMDEEIYMEKLGGGQVPTGEYSTPKERKWGTKPIGLRAHLREGVLGKKKSITHSEAFRLTLTPELVGEIVHAGNMKLVSMTLITSSCRVVFLCCRTINVCCWLSARLESCKKLLADGIYVPGIDMNASPTNIEEVEAWLCAYFTMGIDGTNNVDQLFANTFNGGNFCKHFFFFTHNSVSNKDCATVPDKPCHGPI